MNIARHSQLFSFGRITRLGVAAAAVSGLAVLGACAEGGVSSKIAGVEGPVRAIHVVPLGFGATAGLLAGTVTVCIGAGSAAGSYVVATEVGTGISGVTLASAPVIVASSTLGPPHCNNVYQRTDATISSTHLSEVVTRISDYPGTTSLQSIDCYIENGSHVVDCNVNNLDAIVQLNFFHGVKVVFNFAPCDRMTFGGDVGDFSYGGNVGIKDGVVSGDLNIQNKVTGEHFHIQDPSTYQVGPGNGGIERIITGTAIVDGVPRAVVFSITDIEEPSDAADVVTIQIDGGALEVNAQFVEGGNLQIHRCKE